MKKGKKWNKRKKKGVGVEILLEWTPVSFLTVRHWSSLQKLLRDSRSLVHAFRKAWGRGNQPHITHVCTLSSTLSDDTVLHSNANLATKLKVRVSSRDMW